MWEDVKAHISVVLGSAASYIAVNSFVFRSLVEEMEHVRFLAVDFGIWM